MAFLPRPLGGEVPSESASASDVQTWFLEHVTLAGAPYTLDLDQAAAVLDQHKNTLVVARAGSGKTRVIVAKIAFLVATKRAHPAEILGFMFNRTAAAEVNERIAAVKIDGQTLAELDGASDEIHVASTFHKFALKTVELTGARPDILTEERHSETIKQSFDTYLADAQLQLAPRDYKEDLELVSNFITRAGQKYPGRNGLKPLRADLMRYISAHADDPAYQKAINIHTIAFNAYQRYLDGFTGSLTDFNLLLQRATELIRHSPPASLLPIKYLLIDEYQDFSFLFFALVEAIRAVCPEVHLFAVGDDWQAINRFAGSDVDYFLNFQKYFPEDVTTIPLLTNYRSARVIVENANDYMLENYDSEARRAVAFSRAAGKVRRRKIQKTRFDPRDFGEDALGDGRFQCALVTALGDSNAAINQVTKSSFLPVLKLLKSAYRIIKKHRRSDIMLLHRHNFLSTGDLLLENFAQALKILLAEDAILPAEDFERQIRYLTIHKSKGLEAEVVLLLEFNREIIYSKHPHARLFEIFGDNIASEKSDQHRLLYVALTRAKKHLYLLTSDNEFPA